jgi:hypothetical protein
MKLNVIHPGESSLGVIKSTIDQGEPIYRSPHVGNVNASELSLMLGIDAMGGSMQIELVDTIRGDDRYSDPRNLVFGGRVITLASRNYAKSRVVGGCDVEPSAIEAAKLLGVKIDDGSQVTLKTLHTDALVQAMPQTVAISTSSEYFSSIGEQAYQLVLAESGGIIDRPLRMVDGEGKLREVMEAGSLPIYGLDGSKEGLLPPLEAMMAIEAIKKVLDSGGTDSQIVHVAGPDMIRYTKLDEVMGIVSVIADRVLGELGISKSVQVDYVVPCMKTVLGSSGFAKVLGGEVQSQYDILVGELQRVS